MSDEIDAYVDGLAEHLHAGGSRLRRVLVEAEDHLRESASALVAQGLDEDAAAAEAISRFGTAKVVAERMRPTHAALALDLLRGGWLLSGWGLVAIGVSGLVAELLFQTVGATFVAGDSFGVTYTPARCAEFLEYSPTAGSCASAAALHHTGEVVTWRVAAGILGILMLVVYRLHRRRGHHQPRVIPDGAVPMVAAASFGAAAIVLLLAAGGLWVGQAANGETVAGVGDPLSGGLVAVLAAALAATITAHRLAIPRRLLSRVSRS